MFDHILPLFKAKTGIDVKVISQGTGQALDTGRRGDADVVFVQHGRRRKNLSPTALASSACGDVQRLRPDRAEQRSGRREGRKDIVAAITAIKDKAAPFVSRGDKSGTHAAELALWKAAAIDIAGADKGPWYREIGQGMGAALNTASAMNGYVLADRGTWLSFKNRGELDIVVEGDKRLFNQYGVIWSIPDKHAHVKKDMGRAFIDWLVSSEGQKAIAEYKITASSCSSRMPTCRARDGSAFAGNARWRLPYQAWS